MVCALLSHGHHVTPSCDIICCDYDLRPGSGDTFLYSPSLYSKFKKKKRKRNINNDLAVLPSHNTYFGNIM